MLSIKSSYLAPRLGLILHLLFLGQLVHGFQQVFEDPLSSSQPAYFQNIDSLLSVEPDSSIINLQEKLERSYEDLDTLASIKFLNKLAALYSNRSNYNRSYDGFWKALLLAEKIGHKASQSASYNGLAILYNLYNREEKALEYYKKALAVNKQLLQAGEISQGVLIANYYPLAIHFRVHNDNEKAKAYLDSCQLVDYIWKNDRVLVQAEYGYILISEGKYAEADVFLKALEEDTREKYPSYMVIFYGMMGDLYKDWGKFSESEDYYDKSLQAARFYRTHLNYVPDVYKRRSDLYSKMGQTLDSYESLILSYTINESLYSSRSQNNRNVLEIKDEVREEQERRNKAKQGQRLKQLEQEERILFLRLVIAIGSIVFLLIVGFILFKHLQSRHKHEKHLLEQEQKLQTQKSQDILNIKNGELAGSTVQLIAKDELLSEIAKKLKELRKNPDKKEITRLINSIQINANQNWEEFERRFTAVNSEFYNNLRKKFPSLTAYDLRICALIRLNFSGKEMANLLGVSIESAYTARYRLRKRLGLSKEVDLPAYIQNI